MKKLIHHRWFDEPAAGTGEGLLQRKVCGRCECKKGYSPSFGKTIYVDRFGRMHYKAPSCVLPNTKL